MESALGDEVRSPAPLAACGVQLLGFFEAVAFGFEVDDLCAMDESVDERDGARGVMAFCRSTRFARVASTHGVPQLGGPSRHDALRPTHTLRRLTIGAVRSTVTLLSQVLGA